LVYELQFLFLSPIKRSSLYFCSPLSLYTSWYHDGGRKVVNLLGRI